MSSYIEQTESNLSVVFTGGGTGGHLYPALALAKALKQQAPDARILFIGTARLEAEKVPAEGFPIRIISVRGLAGSWKSPKGLLRKLTSAALLGLGIPVWQSLAILRKFKPNLVVGTGGYVCGPVIFAARLLKIPSMSVEQNVYPGLTTRALARLVNAAALICDESVAHYPTPHGLFSRPGLPRLVVTGNPIREEILKAKKEEGLAAFSLSPERQTVLVCGGSLGSPLINRTFLEALETLADEHWFRSGVQIIHMTGRPRSAADTIPELGERARRAKLRYHVFPYLDNMPLAYAAADLVISRGGGTTIAELTARGLPAIIIPWAGAANDEQYHNSRPLSRAGGAIVMKEDEFTTGRLISDLRTLLQNPDRLRAMSAATRALGNPDAAEKILALMIELASPNKALQQPPS